MVRRRVLRRVPSPNAHQITILPTYPQPVRRAASVLGTVLYAPGALLLLVSFTAVLLNWLAGMLGDATIPALLAPLLPWLPVLFAAGAALSVVGTILSPSVEKFVLTVVFVAGFLAIWLGII